MGKTPNFEQLYNSIRESENWSNVANHSRLARVIESLLKDSIYQQQLHDAAFEVSAAIAKNKGLYESTLATAMSKLLVATAKHEIQANAKVIKPNAKVIKHTVKAKVATEAGPKTIHASYVKALISNAQKTITMQTMIDNGVPQHLAQKAAGDVYDPVVGVGAASDDIWGPVV